MLRILHAPLVERLAGRLAFYAASMMTTSCRFTMQENQGSEMVAEWEREMRYARIRPTKNRPGFGERWGGLPCICLGASAPPVHCRVHPTSLSSVAA
jgi:hypothetical protein